MAFAIGPEALKYRKRLAVVEPHCPTEIVGIPGGIDGPKLAAAFCEDVVILAAGFKLESGFDFRTDGINDFFHVVEFEPEDCDFGMLEGVKKTSRVRPIRSCLAFTVENVCNIPPERFDLR